MSTKPQDRTQYTEDRRAVKAYLDAIIAPKRRGRQVTFESLQRQVDAIEVQLAAGRVPSMKRLELVQRRNDLLHQSRTLTEPVDVIGLETSFIASAARYGAVKGIEWETWREVGVPVAVLKKAGVARR